MACLSGTPSCGEVSKLRRRCHGHKNGDADHDARLAGSPRNASTALFSKLTPYSSSSTRFIATVSFLIAVGYPKLHGARAQDTYEVATEQDSASGSSEDGSSVLESILQYVLIVLLVTASGLFSGLTLGLLGLDKIGLEIIRNGDDLKTAGYAKVRTNCSSTAVSGSFADS